MPLQELMDRYALPRDLTAKVLSPLQRRLMRGGADAALAKPSKLKNLFAVQARRGKAGSDEKQG